MLRTLADRTTLRGQIGWIAGLIGLLIVVVTTVGSTLLARGQAMRGAESALLFVARSVADRLDQDMAERLREVHNLAALDPLQGLWLDDPARLRGVLDRMQSTLPDYAWIGFADRNGRVRAATGGLLEGATVAERPWFKSGMQGAAVEDVHKAQLLESLLKPNADGSPFRFVDVATPVFDRSGRLIGVLGAHLSWKWADVVRAEVLSSRRSELKEEIQVLDRAGRVLLGAGLGTAPYGAADLAAGRFVDRRPEGDRLAAASVTRGRGAYGGLGWVVVALRPVEVALAGSRHLTWLMAGLGLAAAALGMVAFAFLAARLSRPLTRLTEAVDRIGREPNATMIERMHGSVEILHLSAAMRSLLRRVGAAEADARRVEETASGAVVAAEQRVMRLGADLHALQLLADTDALTGLLNRRAFLPFANDAMNYFKRYRRSLVILMVDIDHFKRVNDTFGHAAGDEVIKEVGRIVTEALRTTDKVARFGGEEFVVLLRETDLAGATIIAERIRQTVARTAFDSRETAVTCTVSIGVAEASARDRDIEHTIERADRALYAAKSNGRNRVRAAEGSVLEEVKAAA